MNAQVRMTPRGYAIGRPRHPHRWDKIPVGWRGTPAQVQDIIGISRRSLEMKIRGEHNCCLPPGFTSKKVGARHYIERVADVPIRN